MKKQIKLLKAYNPGESPESLRNKYDNNKSFFKLGSNENVYGPSPNVKKSIINHVNEINYYPDTLKLQNYFRNLFVLRTFSKAYGLAGMRVGYVIAPQEIIEQWNIVKLPFNVGCLSEYAAVEAIKDQEYLRKICYYNKVEREKFFSIPESRNFYPSQTNFIFVKTENPNLLYEMLLEKGFITKLFSKGVRITIGLPEQNEGIIKVIKKFFK